LKRFSVKDGNHYAVQRFIRDACIFAKQDIVKDPPFHNLDLISCCNVLIYDYGIGFDPFDPGTLFASNNGTDVRMKKRVIDTGRPVDNDWDDLFVIRVGFNERPSYSGWVGAVGTTS
jgi:hypothetical protein